MKRHLIKKALLGIRLFIDLIVYLRYFMEDVEYQELLFQIKEGFQFPKCENAPPQASGFYPDKRSPFPWYDLFARNRIYFWGTDARKDAKVYISVQHG